MAQLTRPDLHAEIELRFPNNTNELITPLVVREFLHELVDAAQLPASDKVAVGQALTLAQAQAILSSAPGAAELTTGWLYLVSGAWNAGAAGQVVAVTAIGPRAFASFGTLVNGATAKAVSVAIATGTTGELAAPDLSTITRVLDQHTLQLKTLGVQAAPVMAYLESGDVEGYATLDEALADTRAKTFMRFNVATVRVTKSNDPLNPGWAAYVDGAGTTIELAANVVLSIPGSNLGTLLFKNFFVFQAPGTRGGRVKLLATGNASTPPGLLPLLDGQCAVPLELSGGAVALRGAYGSLQGTGTVHLYEPYNVDFVASGITLVKHEAGAGGEGFPMRNTNVITFDASAQYPTIYSSNSFTVNIATKTGSGVAMVLVYPMQYGPDLSDPIFELSQGSVFVPYLKQLFTFLWGLDSKIQVVITPF